MSESSLRLFRLVQNQVHVGKPLPFGVRDENGKLLLARGHVVSDDDQLAALIERGAYVDLEELRQLKNATPPEKVATRKLTLFDAWEQIIWRLDRLLRSPTESAFSERSDELARACVALVRRDPDIGIYLARRQDARRLSLYGLTHALHTALTCQLMAQRMSWDEAKLLTLVKAALTMNMTIFELQGQLAVQGRRPDDVQQARLRAHPQAAHDALVAAGVTDPAWLEAVLQHHERVGGSGYPLGAEPGELGCALRCADVFMAKISPRTDRPPIPIQEAERQLFADTGASAMAAALIKEFGIYPPGDFVQLKSGELAMVVRRGATVNTPMVAAITDRKGMPIVGTNIRDTAKPEFAVAGPSPDQKLVLRVPPERLFGLPE
ncbi:HD-GYP domain-containing protein [Roseateles saccharophilus]|uniref:HD domain-containing protein n=1 Tax=Roseateles saccharophilus TaxID=304 RepID=A0A4R3UC05_ROSSA|nr:HD domain-containing phosphohydrolase [Roseateles saccharophilus]MDG0835760.1 phosphohydrolase [Roseateles saccharophilus]TCU84468.1 HD domain-containing protein [Roseateles saccharophilus]